MFPKSSKENSFEYNPIKESDKLISINRGNVFKKNKMRSRFYIRLYTFQLTFVNTGGKIKKN